MNGQMEGFKIEKPGFEEAKRMLNARGKVARKGMEFGPSCTYTYLRGTWNLPAQGRLIEGVPVHSVLVLVCILWSCRSLDGLRGESIVLRYTNPRIVILIADERPSCPDAWTRHRPITGSRSHSRSHRLGRIMSGFNVSVRASQEARGKKACDGDRDGHR